MPILIFKEIGFGRNGTENGAKAFSFLDGIGSSPVQKTNAKGGFEGSVSVSGSGQEDFGPNARGLR